jgi:catechol 2,3-dioxygenase-like lactoylglutathione lyase family enzyme
MGGSLDSPCLIKRLGYLSMRVADLGRSVDFYTRGCNLRLVERLDGVAYLRCRYEHHCLVLHQSGAPGLERIAFETLDDSATDRLRHDLQQRGVPTRESADEPGRSGLSFQFQDPEGVWVEVYRTMSRLAGTVSPGPFNLVKLGHFNIATRQLEAQKEFYRGIGFRVSDYRRERGLFMRCNPDHHGLAFIAGNRAGLRHHAYELSGWDQMKLVLDWMFREGITPTAGPHRHGPGNNIALYVRDPDRFHIEFYCEMEQIEDDEDHEREYLPFWNLWLRQGPPPEYQE